MPGQLPKSLRARARTARRHQRGGTSAAEYAAQRRRRGLASAVAALCSQHNGTRAWRGASRHGEAFLTAAARLRLSSALETDRWNFFKLTLDCNVNTPYSQLTAVCGATRRLMPILFETKHGLYAVSRQFSVFHTHEQHSRRGSCTFDIDIT